ncbi:hypothetical protein [Actinacidiphila glaucinigra]|uniref:Uncharacterized protein n=1 Tax=Actinacidiphila glaucinigra TaxID=235986 RepID=A0A239BB98_9ACTN|nr:hypothetical protein [Actinacidiphila glaucinigra]SNS05265.1 hypothetical protein SAMN05216252_102527 [Actinacidiphila glaucinigra]
MSELNTPGELPRWRGRDAVRWAACRPAAWARPRWGALALAAAAAAAAVAAPEAFGAAHYGLAAVQLYWLLRLPGLTLVSAPVLAALLVWRVEPQAAVPAVAALLVCWGGARHRTGVRRRQRLLAANAAHGVRLPLPEPLAPLRRGLGGIASGLLLCAAAVPPQTRLLALAGVALLAAGVAARMRAGALRRGGQPVLRVLTREDEDARTWVFAADDHAGRRALFSCPVDPEPETPSGLRDDGLRPALLFGAPCEGAELLLLSADSEGGALVDRAAGPVRPA